MRVIKFKGQEGTQGQEGTLKKGYHRTQAETGSSNVWVSCRKFPLESIAGVDTRVSNSRMLSSRDADKIWELEIPVLHSGDHSSRKCRSWVFFFFFLNLRIITCHK
jgi:hypothetical protein